MHNVEMSIKHDILTLTIDLKAEGRRSNNPRRKNMVIASTMGTKPLIGEDGRYRKESINLSIWREADTLEKTTWR